MDLIVNNTEIEINLNEDIINFQLKAIAETGGNFRLLEEGDYRLLEDGEIRLLE